VRALAASEKAYRVRALTRDPASAPSKALEVLGCEVVQADMSSSADLDKAFSGGDFAFCMTLSDYEAEDALEAVSLGNGLFTSDLTLAGIPERQTPDGCSTQSGHQGRCLCRRA
jgi:uncharacterized protein YbjT (DUF2867 family)